MEILNRRQASEQGLHKYYTGTGCLRGHDSLRYTNTGACVACVSGYAKRYRVPVHKLIYVRIALHDRQDIDSLKAYAQALNFQRELEDVASGKL